MKKQLLALAALLLPVCGAFAQGTWVPQSTGFPNTSTGVFNISVVDANTVWISAYDGAGTAQNYRNFSMTIDGGATWIPNVVPAPAGHAWSMIHGLDDQTAWAVMYNATAGWGGGIWKTTDGGVNWTQQGAGQIYNTTNQSFPNVVHFWDANNGFAMGDPVNSEYELYTTTDGGTNWVAVPVANIPAPTAGEYGIVDHYDVKGDTIWFDTNKGRVFRSVDRGLNWTVATTGITVPTNQAMDIAFWNENEGVCRLFNGNTGAQTAVRTTDGGLTWTPFTPTGNMLGGDIRYVPGTASRLVSTGANATYTIGSSFSNDGGLTWTDIEIGTQRTALGVFDINTMWAGGFTTSPTTDGIFKFEIIGVVSCGDPTITPGVMTAPDYTICFGDTLFITTAGALAPNIGTTFGYSVIVSTNDISGSTTPLGPGVVGGTGIVYPVPATVNTTLVNNGVPFTPGVYYFTPVVYGNATGTGNIFNLTLDPACTYTGTSVMVTLYAAGDPACLIGVNEINNISLNVFQSSENILNLNIGAAGQRNLDVTLFDVAGRMALTQKIQVSNGSNSHQLDISGLAQGTYAVRVSDNEGAATIKFVKF